MSDLFSPITIRGHEIKNRIIFPAMCLVDSYVPNDVMNDDYLQIADRVTKIGPGIFITGAVCVDPNGKLNDNQLGVWNDSFIPGLAKLSDICHKNGSLAIMQIHHAGMHSVASCTDEPLSSSDFDLWKNNFTMDISGCKTADGAKAREMTREEILKVEDEFVEAAIRAEKAGYDGIEIHSAHAYLLAQFITPHINHRTDEYGGSLENRARFTTEIIRKIRAAVSDNFIISVRFGCYDDDINAGAELGKIFEASGADLLNVSYCAIFNGGLFDGTAPIPSKPDNIPVRWMAYSSSIIKKEVNIPVTAVFGIQTPEQAEWLMEHDWTDFVCVLRGLLCDDQWVEKARNHMPVDVCFDCKPDCKWFWDRNKCPRKILKERAAK